VRKREVRRKAPNERNGPGYGSPALFALIHPSA
jgi:hypothetical protein